jgi:transcription elongation GreA/GreB family factor
MQNPELKARIHSLCLASIDQRIETAKQAIAISQEAANEETKNAAGDKYETGRAMAQLEIEKDSTQLAEAQKLRQALLQINPVKSFATIQGGSLVLTTQGNFYIAVSAGQFVVDGETYVAISSASPIGAKMMGLKEGDQFQWNKKDYKINMVR